jgi:PPIC-type PPIASE domain
MQRSTALLYTLSFIGAVAFVIARTGPKERGPTGTVADAGADVDGAGPTVDDAGVDGGELPTSPGVERDPRPEALRMDAGTTLLSGEAPPSLASDAPKKVRFGVVLVQYRGAQGATPTARTREAALALARQLADLAKTDFKAAIAKGDKGSTDDLGYMPRGVLEPAPEYELFSLPKGGVSGPVDTPRGYWIAQRIE